MSKRARAFGLARELKHADSECYGEPVDVDALVGDTVACDVRQPVAATISATLETPAAVEYANRLLQDKGSGWRLVDKSTKGQHEQDTRILSCATAGGADSHSNADLRGAVALAADADRRHGDVRVLNDDGRRGRTVPLRDVPADEVGMTHNVEVSVAPAPKPMKRG